MNDWGLSLMSDEELRAWMASHSSGNQLIAGIEELLRRRRSAADIPAWLAIGTSLLSLFISLLALLR
jgi:hypothetical protein